MDSFQTKLTQKTCFKSWSRLPGSKNPAVHTV